MKIQLIASDLDGTIIDRDNKIAKENFDAIDRIHNDNLIFVVCTGKSYSVSRTICKKLKADFGIFGNGAQIVDLRQKKELARKVLKKEELNYCINLARTKNLHIHLYTEDSIITEELKYMDLRNYVLKDDNSADLKFFIVPTIENYIKKENPAIFSLVISSEKSLSNFEKNVHNNVSVSTNLINKKGIYKDIIINKEYEYLNIAPAKINKNQGLKYLSKYLNIPEKNMLAIGDNINDSEMIKNCGIGVAVADAYDEIKEIADYITKNPVSKGAFAETIDKYIK